MKRMDGSWLRQGYFVLGNTGFMGDVRDQLEQARRLPKGSLRIHHYPADQVWKHTYWWREGKALYVEAQSFAQIAREYPVLALGVSVEKGYELASRKIDPAMRMDRRTWDWRNFVKQVGVLLLKDAPACFRALGEPVTLRVSARSISATNDTDLRTRAFSLTKGGWFERYQGLVDEQVIAKYVRQVDAQKGSWAIVHFAYDIGPAEVDRYTASKVAHVLMTFDRIRRRLRGQVRDRVRR